MNRYSIALAIILALSLGLIVGFSQHTSTRPFPEPESAGDEVPTTDSDNQLLAQQEPSIYAYEILHTSTIPNPGMIFGIPGVRSTLEKIT